jgi:hypothetical protein
MFGNYFVTTWNNGRQNKRVPIKLLRRHFEEGYYIKVT